MSSQPEILTPYACLNGMRRVLGFLGTRDAMRSGYLDVPGRVGLLGLMVRMDQWVSNILLVNGGTLGVKWIPLIDPR